MVEYRLTYDEHGKPVGVIIPRYAFKFAPVNDNTLASLRESYLWFSRPCDFNDIFELPTKAVSTYTEADIRAYIRANVAHHWPRLGITPPPSAALNDMIDQLLASDPDFLPRMFRAAQHARRDLVRIHCLSMRYNDPLMWAHYSASYSGVCLVYEFTQLVQAGPWFALQVQYVREPPTYDPIGQSLGHLTSPSPYDDAALQFEHDQLQFGTKLHEWAHEQELRLCTLSPDARLPYPRSALVGVNQLWKAKVFTWRPPLATAAPLD